MICNAVSYEPLHPAATDRAEPLSTAVLEVSDRIAECNAERRRLHARLDELRSADPALRRSRARALPADPLRLPTFFSIEEADAVPPARQVRRA